MNKEVAPIATAQAEALNPPVIEEAIALRQQETESVVALHAIQNLRNRSTHASLIDGMTRIQGESMSSAIVNPVIESVKGLQLSNAKRASKKHYKKNEATYQFHAVEDATKDGVVLNGWNQK